MLISHLEEGEVYDIIELLHKSSKMSRRLADEKYRYNYRLHFLQIDIISLQAREILPFT
jgi:hypothetical protein